MPESHRLPDDDQSQLFELVGQVPITPTVWVSYVGTARRDLRIDWPAGWPIPRKGDEIGIPGLPEITHVRLVEWHPLGESEEDPEPYVYIVLGPHH